MPTNPFDELNELAPSQNYGDKNPFDDIFEQENKEREEKLRQILHTVSTLDPDKTGEAQKLAERLNLPPGVALNSDETTNILLLSSARAGGTFFGKLLNDIFPDSFYTFNPLFVASFSQVSHIHYSNCKQVLDRDMNHLDVFKSTCPCLTMYFWFSILSFEI